MYSPTLSTRLWVKTLPSCLDACDVDAERLDGRFLYCSGITHTSLISILMDYSWCRRRVRRRTHMTDHLPLNNDGKRQARYRSKHVRALNSLRC